MITAARARALVGDCETCAAVVPRHFGPLAAEVLGRHRAPIASVYVEARLGAAAGPTDLLFAFNHAHARKLAAELRGPAGEGPRYRPQLHAGFSRLVEQWARPDSRVAASVPTIWLELDGLDELGPGVELAPSISACLIPGYLRFTAPLPASAPRSELALMGEVITALRGAELDARTHAQLARVLAALPPGAKLIHLSYMGGREPAATKLYLVVPRAAALTLLAELGWRGPSEELAALLDDLAPPRRVGDELYLDLTLDDLDAPGGGRVGLAFAQQQLQRSAETEASRGPLLAACLARGLCNEAQARALEAWPGRERPTLPGDTWPSLIRRWLDLKLVWRAKAPLELKAYLGWSARAAGPFDRV